MIGKLINLPFKVIGKAARAVQERNDAQMRQTHGEGTEGDDWSELSNVPDWDTPPDYDPGRTGLTVADLKKRMASGQALTIIDVRTPQEFRGGSIEGADNLPLNTLTIRLAELPPDERVVAVCDNGRDSKEATRFLRFRGIEDIWYLEGGLTAWRKSRSK